MSILKNDWADILAEEFEKPYYLELREFLKKEYATTKVFPSMYDIFNALHYTPYAETKIVILGQDPYHGHGQAHGLSFSVQPGVPTPPSLQNIYKELEQDVGFQIPNHGHLIEWAKQGVLLLNTVLTVRQGQPNSHKGMGWETFTDQVIRKLNEREKPVIFILWGKHAQEKKLLITNPQHSILQSPHPSPFSARRGFFGSRPFSTANQLLQDSGQESVKWNLQA
ncbi:uracil-DNA glycosylase [Bacillus horti]|uniref:Uracil-DNA glycosylase n=1 Tax=Caldalkalibacillus horti TaxID=77523 RepID=A0ABT9VWS8_9BACI|nr:uracil-DNA glycosylase [Bacillus horti]MDQ0165060.1 uracil-DNA glycosylase [Bacillus horti]